MNRQSVSEKIEVMTAFDKDRIIQTRVRHFMDYEWNDVDSPDWNWHDFDYRVKPIETTAPMTRDDFNGSPSVWIRNSSRPGSSYFFTIRFDEGGIVFGGEFKSFEELYHSKFEWSSTRIIWQPFKKES